MTVMGSFRESTHKCEEKRSQKKNRQKKLNDQGKGTSDHGTKGPSSLHMETVG